MGNSQIQYAYEREDAPHIDGETRPYRHISLKPDEDCVCELYPGVDTIKKAFARSVDKFGDKHFLGKRTITGTKTQTNARTKKEETVNIYGDYEWKTFNEINQITTALSKAVTKEKLFADVIEDDEPHRMIGIFAKNSFEWLLSDIAFAQSNITSVTLYDTLGADSTEYIVDQCELSTLCLTADKIKSLLELKKEGRINTLKNFILLDDVSDEEIKECEGAGVKVHKIYDLVNEGESLTDVKLMNPNRDSIYTICYTSGTTGDPKGVKLSHINLICSGAALIKINVRIGNDDIHLSYLPLAHVLERIVCVALAGRGARIGMYQGDILKLKDDLSILKPTIFVSVPRLFNRFYDGMMSKIQALTGMKKKLADWAISSKMAKLEKSGDPTHSIYDRLVFNKFKEAIGGNVRMMITGSAPISKDVINFLKIAFCCPFYEGYGQTETAGGSCLTFSEDGESGHVGGVLPQHELKLVDIPEMDYLKTDKDEEGNPLPRGEICFKGHSNFLGYFKLPEKTKETIDERGWVHTGDIGAILPNGALKIIDRKKNIFKLAQGEYIAPEKLENAYNKIDIVKQIFVYGDSLQSNLVTIIVPEDDEVRKIGEARDIDTSNLDEFYKSKEWEELVKERFDTTKKECKFSGLEIPRRFFYTREEFTLENDLLTPTMKLKRNEAKAKYIGQIREMYDGAKLQGEE
jgi:long-chain acyl-CoA synthetase